jgi:putative peptide zinc metalloprotease protein
VGLRDDLEVSRHVFRGEVSYIVRDPMTFQSQRLDRAAYELFVSIEPGRALSDIFATLVEQGRVNAEDEDEFYHFVLNLHRLGFLRLPISDDKLLYRRYQMRERARRREKLMGFLFLRIPLWNPDAFLTRTVHLVRPLFGRAALSVWALLVGVALLVALRQWNDLVEPLHGILVAQNLPLMWLTLIVLKLFHEMGHAYACKHFGGHVPEMGVYLIVFTPCAYMDASSSWGFTSKRQRLFVCLAGVYVEALIAALAVFVWSMTEPSWLHSLAYNVMFLASIVTALFNINPLMRYDGYYLLSDLAEVPNLRQRSNRSVLDLLKRILLGLSPTRDGNEGRRLRVFLTGYGIAVSTCRLFLYLGIAAILVAKMAAVGLGLAVVFLGGLAYSLIRRLTGYLWYAEETATIRGRAVGVSLATLIVIPAALAFLPVPAHERARAVVHAEQETLVRAATPGFVEQIDVTRGQSVRTGVPLARLSNDSVLEEIATAESNVAAARIRRDAYYFEEPARAFQEEARALVHEQALAEARTRLAELDVRAPTTGRVIASLRPEDVGRFLPRGDILAAIIDGPWELRTVLTEDQMARVQPRIGDRATFRAAGCRSHRKAGRITQIAPAGSRTVRLPALTQLGGGEIPVDRATRQATQPYFEVTVSLPADPNAGLRYGMTGSVRFAARAEPILRSLGRRFIRFWNRMLEG